MSYRRNLPHPLSGQTTGAYGYRPLDNERRTYVLNQTANSGGSRVHQSSVRNNNSNPPVRVVHYARLSSASAGEYIYPNDVFSLDNLHDEAITDERALLDRDSPPLRHQPHFSTQVRNSPPHDRPINHPWIYEDTQQTGEETHHFETSNDNQYTNISASQLVAADYSEAATNYDHRDFVGLSEILITGPPRKIMEQQPPATLSEGSAQFPEVPQLIPAFRPSTQNTAVSGTSAIELLIKITGLADLAMTAAQNALLETEWKHLLKKLVPGVPKLKKLLELLEALCNVVGRACFVLEDMSSAFRGSTPEEIKSAYDAAIDTCIRMSLDLGNIAAKQKGKHRVQAVGKQMVLQIDLLGTKLQVLVMSMVPYVPQPRENADSIKGDDHFLGKRMRRVHEDWMTVPRPLAYRQNKKHEEHWSAF